MSSIQSSLAPPGVFTPIPSYLFTANVKSNASFDPIPLLEGGQRIVEPIVGGDIQGPGFNATIEGGVAAPTVVSTGNGTEVKFSFVWVYGHASDGSPFFIEESGIGTTPSQSTRLIIHVGGQYADLQSIYILAQPTLNEDHTEVLVECFSVPLP